VIDREVGRVIIATIGFEQEGRKNGGVMAAVEIQ
jgi:hypothetical protein